MLRSVPAKEQKDMVTEQENLTIEERATEWFVALRDPDLSEEQRLAFENWLARDETHRKAYQDIQELWDLVPEVGEPAVSQDILEAAELLEFRQKGRRNNGIPRGERTGHGFRSWAAAAAVLLMVGAGYLSLQGQWLFADYTTASGEQTLVELQDGSSVLLNVRSAVSVRFDEQQRHVSLFEGEAYFSVEKDRGRPFVVETELGSVHVLGTAFAVRRIGDSLRVSVTENTVRLEGLREAPVVLQEGETIELEAEQLSDKRPLNRLFDLAWMKGRLVFENAPLTDVLSELERYGERRILAVGPALDDISVTGSFPLDNVDAVLEDLEKSLPVRLVRVSGYLVFVYPENRTHS